MTLSRIRTPRVRRLLAGAAAAAGLAIALTACSSGAVPGDTSSSAAAEVDAYDSVISAGPIADDSVIADNAWATKIKEAGELRRGGTDTGALFSIQDPATGKVTGFDAGIGDLLARYILGDDAKVSLTQTTVDTRETLLQNDSVDVVIATYSITEPRAEKIAFAGPYYSSGASVMVKKDNDTIKSIDDLVSGTTVTTESNSTAVTALDEFAPDAEQVLFTENADCVAAVQQGRADAYVIDESILLSNAVQNPDLKVVGEPFTSDPYGVGVTKDDPSAKEFVNAFLTEIEEDGSWAELWKATVGTVVEGDAPTFPEIGSVPGS
ncbi:glutamate ABC transporter substrate-binding protein [Microbacteriaceae bacterium VKM Ac-2855]|nr:glutamate ABC transporter substrate-binding protein [Microbacteriaceae bacterium VKM Ac-2855]